MNINRINKEFLLKKGMYNAVLYGLTSTMYSYQNGIIHLQVYLRSKRIKNYPTTAYKIAHAWKNSIPELKNAIGCKIFIIDLDKSHNAKALIDMGVKIDYHAQKGILFAPNQLN